MVYKIVTFNLKRCVSKKSEFYFNKRVDAIEEFFTKVMPDIIGTQELTYSTITQIESFLKDYKWVGLGRLGGKNGEFSAIFFNSKKFDLIEQDTFWLSKNPKRPGSRDWFSLFPRICTWCILKDKNNGNILRIYNTHLDHISPFARFNSIKLITQYATKYDNPTLAGTILMGDFNASPKSNTLQSLLNSENNINLFKENSYTALLKLDTTELYTYHGLKNKNTGRPIDYIFTSNNIKIEKVLIDRNLYAKKILSDHYPVVVEIAV
ncbi:MAG: endonuclease/exonuclease/phosphatase [Clostridia bacterium]|nr:endonuclease/exonuclease/phosphatase [Clostridia bacterium]